MTDDVNGDSLAAAAAAWVPPWERRPEPPVEPEADVAPESVATVEPEAVADGDVGRGEVSGPDESVLDEMAATGAWPVSEPDLTTVDSDASGVGTLGTDDPADVSNVDVGSAAEVAAVSVSVSAPVSAPADALDAEPVDAEAVDAEPAEAAGEAEPSVGLEAVEAGEIAALLDAEEPSLGTEDGALFGISADVEAAAARERDLRPALEAILLVVDEPVAEGLLAQILELPVARIANELEAIATEYTAHGRGFELRRAAGGWRLYTRPEYASYVERFVLDGQSVRLTQAALETLAVVAYKQPVTRSRISAIRGVNCDGVVRTLVTRGLVEECGAEAETGAHLYRTTVLFLEKLGLDTVDQLPSLAPFLPDNVDEIADAQQ